MSLILAPPRSNLPTTCCCGCSLKTGVVIIAVSSTVLSVIGLLMTSALIHFSISLTDNVGLPLMLALSFELVSSILGCCAGCLCCGLASHKFAQGYLYSFVILSFYGFINSLVYIVNPESVAERLCEQVRDALSDLDVGEFDMEICTTSVIDNASSEYWKLAINLTLRIYFVAIIYAFERQLADTVKNGGEAPPQYQAYVMGGQAPTVVVTQPVPAGAMFTAQNTALGGGSQLPQTFPTDPNYPTSVAPVGSVQAHPQVTVPFINAYNVGGQDNALQLQTQDGHPEPIGLHNVTS